MSTWHRLHYVENFALSAQSSAVRVAEKRRPQGQQIPRALGKAGVEEEWANHCQELIKRIIAASAPGELFSQRGSQQGIPGSSPYLLYGPFPSFTMRWHQYPTATDGDVEMVADKV